MSQGFISLLLQFFFLFLFFSFLFYSSKFSPSLSLTKSPEGQLDFYGILTPSFISFCYKFLKMTKFIYNYVTVVHQHHYLHFSVHYKLSKFWLINVKHFVQKTSQLKISSVMLHQMQSLARSRYKGRCQWLLQLLAKHDKRVPANKKSQGV